MRRALVVLAVAVAALPLAASAGTQTASAKHPEARPFGDPKRAAQHVDAALARAATNGRRVLIVFGGNWCHDSRALAGWFATPRFQAMLAANYELVWVDVGRKTKNLDLARRFGLDGIAGTPTVLVLDADGKPRNLSDAPTWRNAATRSEDSIYDSFAMATLTR